MILNIFELKAKAVHVFILSEITAANKANICTYTVMGATKIDQAVS